MSDALEALRQADIVLSMLRSEVADRDMARAITETLQLIDGVLSPPQTSTEGKSIIEYGAGWAKIHFRRDVTEQDRINLGALFAVPVKQE